MNSWARTVGDLNFLSLCLLSCFPILGMKLTVVAIIVFCVLSVAAAVMNPVSLQPLNRKLLVLSLIPILLIFLRTVVMDRSEESLFYFEGALSLLAFPVAFALYQKKGTASGERIPPLLFASSTFVTVLYGLLTAVTETAARFGSEKLLNTTTQMLNDPALSFHIRTIFEETVNLHPTHASVYLGVSLLILSYFFILRIRKSKPVEKLVMVMMVCMIMIMLASLASRTPFAASVFSLLVMIFLMVRKKIYFLYAAGVMALLMIVLVVSVPSLRTRFSEVSFSNSKIPQKDQEDSFNLRAGIYSCGIETVRSNWIWGVGPGNVQEYLNRCYDQISPEVYRGKNYNTHNQYLDFWAGMGLAGPLALIAILLASLYRNFKKRQYLWVAVTLLFAIAMLTENLLNRQNGIVVFGLFLWMSFYQIRRQEKSAL